MALRTINRFSKRAGLRVYVDKTECILTDRLHQYVEKIKGIKTIFQRIQIKSIGYQNVSIITHNVKVNF